MRTVLVVRLDRAGDVLLAGPAVRAVAAQADRVVLLAGPRGRDAAALLPAFRSVLDVDLFGMGSEPLGGRDLPHKALLDELPRRRVYLHPVRWTSPEALAAACRALIGDLAAARQAGMAARTHALRRYGLGRFLAEWDRLLAAAGAG